MHGKIATNLAELPQFKRGLLYCHECGNTRNIGDVAARLRNGWPKCCGYTMSLDSPAERQDSASLTHSEGDR
jgi:hypothetical protein